MIYPIVDVSLREMANPFSLPWQIDGFKHPVFHRFNQVLNLNQYASFPSLAQLNQIFDHCRQMRRQATQKALDQSKWTIDEIGIYDRLKLIDQNQMNPTLYYEEHIFLRGEIPTRLNHYHDFLGACIWMLFPRTKLLFNQWHQHQIKRYGLKQRSKLRDLITLFDESGLILLYQDAQSIAPLFEYDWKTFFLRQKDQWDQQLIPICFGHGLLEQWLAPHPNITAKALPILRTVASGGLGGAVNDQLMNQSSSDWSLIDFFLLDELIYEQFQRDFIKFSEIFDRNEKLPYRTFSPLPMIGIPTYAENQDDAFYENPKCFKNRKKFITQTEMPEIQ